jgi:hypothetical protein
MDRNLKSVTLLKCNGTLNLDWMKPFSTSVCRNVGLRFFMSTINPEGCFADIFFFENLLLVQQVFPSYECVGWYTVGTEPQAQHIQSHQKVILVSGHL